MPTLSHSTRIDPQDIVKFTERYMSIFLARVQLLWHQAANTRNRSSTIIKAVRIVKGKPEKYKKKTATPRNIITIKILGVVAYRYVHSEIYFYTYIFLWSAVMSNNLICFYSLLLWVNVNILFDPDPKTRIRNNIILILSEQSPGAK